MSNILSPFAIDNLLNTFHQEISLEEGPTISLSHLDASRHEFCSKETLKTMLFAFSDFLSLADREISLFTMKKCSVAFETVEYISIGNAFKNETSAGYFATLYSSDGDSLLYMNAHGMNELTNSLCSTDVATPFDKVTSIQKDLSTFFNKKFIEILNISWNKRFDTSFLMESPQCGIDTPQFATNWETSLRFQFLLKLGNSSFSIYLFFKKEALPWVGGYKRSSREDQFAVPHLQKNSLPYCEAILPGGKINYKDFCQLKVDSILSLPRFNKDRSIALLLDEKVIKKYSISKEQITKSFIELTQNTNESFSLGENLGEKPRPNRTDSSSVISPQKSNTHFQFKKPESYQSIDPQKIALLLTYESEKISHLILRNLPHKLKKVTIPLYVAIQNSLSTEVFEKCDELVPQEILQIIMDSFFSDPLLYVHKERM